MDITNCPMPGPGVQERWGLPVLGGKLESVGPPLTLQSCEATQKFQRKEGPQAP